MSRQQQQQQQLLQQHQLQDEDATPPESPLASSEMQQEQQQQQHMLRCTSPLSPSSPVSHHHQQHAASSVPDYSLRSLPPPFPWEIDFVLPSFLSRYVDSSNSSSSSRSSADGLNEEVPALYSEWRETPAVRFRLMVHPVALPAAAATAAAGRERRFLGAFVETAKKEDFPEDWVFQQGCRFYIYAVNPVDYRKSIFKQDTFHFSFEDADRGWHQFVSYHELLEEQFLTSMQDAPPGSLYLRAGCSPVCAAVSRRIRTPCPPAPLPAAAAGGSEGKRQQQGGEETPPVPSAAQQATPAAAAGMGRCGRGFVGLRNHGATCYMNALLQSLYFIGRFRQAVYALSFDTRSTSGPRSVDILERRRCRRKRSRAFAAAGVGQAKRGEAPAAAGAAAAGAAARDLAAAASGSCNGRGPLGTAAAEGQMDVEEETAPAAAAAAPDSDFAAAAAGVLSDDSTDSEDELSDLDESELRDLLMEEEAERRSPPSISLALQNLFLKLYTATEAVPYKELIRSFGWDAADAFTQQDTHELLKLLLDKVEEQMQRTPAEGSVKGMFEGEMETYVECINVTYKSVRKEVFEDINLDVQGCSGVRESLKRLVMPELLEGDNAYDAEQHGKQTARKGVRFVRFPPVCVFLLKRFDFDFARMDTVKVFDRYEFERELDLNEFCEGAGVYELHSVSVHHGDVNSGHYYSFLRPPPGNQWVRFDDDKVYHVSEYAAIGDNFGGEETEVYNYLRGERKPRSRSKPYNAYILVYVNKAQAPHLLADSNPLKVNPQILSRCRTEEQLRRLRARIRNVLEKSVRVKVYHPLQFKYRRFLELPYLSIPPILEFKRSRDSHILSLHDTITQELLRLLYGAGQQRPGDSSGAAAAGSQQQQQQQPKVHFVLHMINPSVESPRFEAIELSPNAYLGDILRRKGGGGGGGLEASLYVLAVPEKVALFSTAVQHDELVRSYCLLFIKYFPSLTRTTRGMQQVYKTGLPQQQQGCAVGADGKDTQEELVICLDVINVPYEWKVRDLEPHVCRLIHQGICDGVIKECPSRAADISRLVSSFPSSLPPLSSCHPYPAPLPVPGKTENPAPLSWVQGASVAATAAAAAAAAIPAPAANGLQLTACLELDSTDKILTNRLVPRKTLRNSKVFSGDLLVFSLDLPPALLEYKEAQQKVGGRPDDLSQQQAFCPSSPEEEGHPALEAAAAAAGAAAGENAAALVPWAGGPPREVRGLSLIPFVPQSRGGSIPPSPPPLPCYVCNDFVDYCLEKQTTEIYHVRLYDPYEFLSKVMSSSGRLLLGPSVLSPSTLRGDVSSLISENSCMSLPGSEGGGAAAAAAAGETDLAASGIRLPVPQHPSADGGTATGGVSVETQDGVSSATNRGKTEDADEDGGSATSPSPVADDPWLHMPAAKPIAIKEFSLSGRLPVRQALQWIAWQFGVDPCRLLLYPEPPLLSDRKVVPLDIDAFVVSNVESWDPHHHQLQRGDKDVAGATGRRQLTLEEAHVQLQSALSWPGALERRRALAAATSPARLPKELHLCLLPHHYRLCSRTVNAALLHPQQQQLLQQLLLTPLPPAALSTSATTPASTVFNYVCLLFSRQAERIGCVCGVIPATSPEGHPHKAADLVKDILARLPPSLAETLKQDYRSSVSSNSSCAAATATEAPAAAAAAKADKGPQDIFGPLRLFISDASHLLRIPLQEQLTWLSLYAPPTQCPSRDAVSNLLAVPLRLEADYTPEEEDLIRSGARQVLLVQHQTPGEREPFGYPFEVLVEPDATLSEIKAQIMKKLRLSKNAWGSCTFFQLGDGVRCWKGPNDTLDWAKHRTITLIAEHSAPYTKHRGHGGMRIA